MTARAGSAAPGTLHVARATTLPSGKSPPRVNSPTDTASSLPLAGPRLTPRVDPARSLNAFPPARRPHRALAIGALVLLHGAAIEWLLHLQATRDRDAARATLLLLLAPRERDHPQATSQLPAPRVATRPLVAPVPLVDVPAPEGPAIVAAPPAAAPASGDGPRADKPAAPLDLKIPKSFFENEKKTPLTPAQEAMRDPRSNHLELTRQEKLDIAFGVIECVAWQREPDGSIYRGPGHYRRVQGISTNPFTAHKPGQEDRPMACVK